MNPHPQPTQPMFSQAKLKEILDQFMDLAAEYAITKADWDVFKRSATILVQPYGIELKPDIM